MVGAAIVLVFSVVLLPLPEVDNEGRVRLINLGAFLAYVAVAVPIGVVWGTSRLDALRAFLSENRAPTEAETRSVLRGPARIARVAGVLWLTAAIIFAGLNFALDPALALPVGITVLLGGLGSVAVAYVLAERLLRAASGRALAAGVPDKPIKPGVTSRSLLAWAMGTAVPLIGLLLVAIYSVAGEDVSQRDLGIGVIALAGIALTLSALVAFFTAKSIADPISTMRHAVADVGKGDLDTKITVYDGSEVGLLQAGFNEMVAGLRERERIRDTFGTYVDPDVAEHVLSQGGRGEKAEVTVMFLDVRDFTGFAERLPPEDVVATLNRLFELAVPLIRSSGGHIDKFVGDGLMAVFGVPRLEPEHARCALEAAQQILAKVEANLAGELEIGIGLNSGAVVAGSIGGAGRLEFSVIGDAVNVAARVEAATRETGDPILLSEATAKQLGDRIELTERPGIALKGKSEPVTLYAPAAPVG